MNRPNIEYHSQTLPDRSVWFAPAVSVSIRLFAILWSVLFITPWAPPTFGLGPRDEAYIIFSHIDFAEGTPWGAGSLHTGGPLGFLRYQVFYGPTYALFIIGNVCIAGVTGLLLNEITVNRLKSWWRVLFIAASVLILSLSEESVWGLLLLVSQLLIPIGARSTFWTFRPDLRWLAWPFLLNLIACALVANAKGSFLLMAGVLATELAFLELLGRRVPVVSASFVGVIALIAHVSGLRIVDWGPYTKHVIDSLAGYAESFSFTASIDNMVLLNVAAFALFATAASSVRQSPDRWQAVVRWSGLVILVWINVKNSLLRQDPVHMRAVGKLGVFFAAYAITYWDQWGRNTKMLSILPGLCFLVLFSRTPIALGLGSNIRQFDSLIHKGIVDAEMRDGMMRRKVATEIKRPWPPTSSVAAFGSYQSLLLGHAGRRVRLPIVATYEIWSPHASQIEREFLSSSNAPDYLLYTTSPTSAEIALTLTKRYEEVERGEQYRVLHRRPAALIVNRRIVFEKDINAEEFIELAPEWRTGPAVAEIRYKKTFLHSLISTFNQPAEAYLVLFQDKKEFSKVRINPLLSAEGIVLSSTPGIWNGDGLALGSIRFGLLTDERVTATALRFEANGLLGKQWNRYFGPKLQVRIYIPEFKSTSAPAKLN